MTTGGGYNGQLGYIDMSRPVEARAIVLDGRPTIRVTQAGRIIAYCETTDDLARLVPLSMVTVLEPDNTRRTTEEES